MITLSNGSTTTAIFVSTPSSVVFQNYDSSAKLKERKKIEVVADPLLSVIIGVTVIDPCDGGESREYVNMSAIIISYYCIMIQKISYFFLPISFHLILITLYLYQTF